VVEGSISVEGGLQASLTQKACDLSGEVRGSRGGVVQGIQDLGKAPKIVLYPRHRCGGDPEWARGLPVGGTDQDGFQGRQVLPKALEHLAPGPALGRKHRGTMGQEQRGSRRRGGHGSSVGALIECFNSFLAQPGISRFLQSPGWLALS
jgi:hypothetical protein